MKKIILLLTLSLCLPQAHATDWLRLLQGAVKAGAAVTITDEQLAEVVADEVKEMDRNNKVCGDDSPYTKRLKRLTKGMKSANGTKLNFKVYKTSDVNALACPDGSVRVFSALMDILDDNELLGVIGHEVGHVALKHSWKAWRSALLRSAASDALGAGSEWWAAMSDSYIGDLTSLALSAKHSRTQETEADDYGYDFLKKAGKNPWAMGLAFKKLKQLSQGKNKSRYDALLQAFSSHPDFDKRIERMRKRAQKDGYSTK
ncbi:MAG: M48 family metalloprotease [Muribaculaceae bacterium]|nr:M48 family metalloprotease [Muribaculaceae bacterium]